MHFTVPTTQELFDDGTGDLYTGYKIYINGMYHCCLRYRQLLSLNTQLRRLVYGNRLTRPPFPPRRLLPLTENQLDGRRELLEAYLQMLGQDQRCTQLTSFNEYFLNAQFETARKEGLLLQNGYQNVDIEKSSQIEILLPNFTVIIIRSTIRESSDQMLKKVARILRLPNTLLHFFGLVLVRLEANDKLVLLRRLMNFEAPLISRLHMLPCKLMIRKVCWRRQFDSILVKNPECLNLLYLQAICDMKQEWTLASQLTHRKLQAFEKEVLKIRYVFLARRQKSYNCIQFENAIVNYPEEDSAAIIVLGHRDLRFRNINENRIFERKFHVTRMRCWRVCTAHRVQTSDIVAVPTLAFEYNIQNKLRWIQIRSMQAMLISVCLQTMVDEMISLSKEEKEEDEAAEAAEIAAENGNVDQVEVHLNDDEDEDCDDDINDDEQPTTSQSSTQINYRQLDNEAPVLSASTASTPSSESSIDQHDDQPSESSSDQEVSSTSSASSSSASTVRFLVRRNPRSNAIATSAVHYRNNSEEELIQNRAFEQIGDADL